MINSQANHLIHDQTAHTFHYVTKNQDSTLAYSLNQGTFDITSTKVPESLRGQGIAALLVQHAYDYAKDQGFKLKGSCSYAAEWLKRHPAYSKD